MTTVSDDTLLEQVLTGERAATDPAVVERCASSDAFAAELRELQSLSERLEKAGQEERETFSSANRLTDTPGSQLVDSSLRSLAKKEPHAPVSDEQDEAADVPAKPKGSLLQGSFGRRLAAAAALFLAVLLGRQFLTEEPQADRSLSGSGGLEWSWVEGALELEWPLVEGAGVFYGLVVRDGDSADNPVLIDEPELLTPRFVLGEERVLELPAEVLVRVEVYGASGARVGAPWSATVTTRSN